MDTESLQAFVAVARNGSFSIAAQTLFLTQPAISKRVSKLEERLNHRLFDRLGRSLHLTEAGQALLPKAEAIIKELKDTERHIQELSGEIVGTLRVATSHHIGLHHLPPILREFASKHANVNLQFEFLDSEQASKKVISGDCELAVVTLAPKIEYPLTSERLWQDKLAVVVGKNHTFASRKNISLAELSQEAAILPDLNTFTGRMILTRFEAAGCTIKVNMATNYLETIKMMVSVGLGWSVLPISLIDHQMVALPLKEAQFDRELGAIYHQKRSLSNAASAFFDILRANI
ncbi:MAG: DNA-binding transcriptional LysR family regulator [Flavobacteriales bacterium]|jgi:DNA-binding transcriptional LysR family regulator